MPALYEPLRQRIRKRIRVLEDAIATLDRLEALEDLPEPLAQTPRERGGRRMRVNTDSAGTWADSIDAILSVSDRPLAAREIVLGLKARGRVFPLKSNPCGLVHSVLCRRGKARGWSRHERRWTKEGAVRRD